MSPAATRLAWILGLAGGAAVAVGIAAYASKPAAAAAGGGKGGKSTTPVVIGGSASVTLTPGLDTQVVLSLSKGGLLSVTWPSSIGKNPTGSTSVEAVSAAPSIIPGTATTSQPILLAGGGQAQNYQAVADGASLMTFAWYDSSGNPQSAQILVSVVT